MFWLRKKKAKELAEKEAIIDAIHKDTYKKIEEAAKSTLKLTQLFDEKSIAELIYKASGAERRK